MAASFVALPAEILENVMESLKRVDHVNLLATCRQLQALVAPLVFQSVSFTAGGVKSTAGSALLAVRRYGILVRELRVKVAPPICADDDCITCKWAGIWDWGLFMEPSQAIAESALEKQNRWLSPDAATLLAAGRAMLPSRPRLVVEFPRSLLTHYGAYHRPEQRNLQNPDECVVYRSGIRATAVFEALSTGQTNHDDGAGRAFGRLSVLNFALQLDPGFYATDAWRRFLGGVEHLELTLHGEVSPLDENPAYRELLEQLGGVFFQHLSAVQRLRFEAHEMGPMGIRSHDHDQQLFPFELSDMPALQELELANVVIGPGLTRRLVSGLRRGPCTLKFSNATVQSLEATMYPPSPGTPYPLLHDSYAEFFDALTDAKMLIRSLHVDPTDCEIRDPEDAQPRHPDVDDIIAAAPALRASRPDLPVFAYSYDCAGGGAMRDHPAQNAWAFVEGRDQAAYARLMAWVDNVKTRYGGT